MTLDKFAQHYRVLDKALELGILYMQCKSEGAATNVRQRLNMAKDAWIKAHSQIAEAFGADQPKESTNIFADLEDDGLASPNALHMRYASIQIRIDRTVVIVENFDKTRIPGVVKIRDAEGNEVEV